MRGRRCEREDSVKALQSALGHGGTDVMMGLTPRDQRQFVGLVMLGTLALVMLGARWVATGVPLLFFVWNMFLAAVPVGAAMLVRYLARKRFVSARRGWVLLGLASLLWLGFFPNAPYIVTDLMHLRNSRANWLWLDVMAIGTCAAMGVYAGLLSLRWMHEALLTRGARPWGGWAFVLGASLAAGFGVYLGRFQRWNTWDILTRPGDLLAGAWSSLGEVRVLAFATLFALAIAVGYAVFTLLVGQPVADEKPEQERIGEETNDDARNE